MSSEQAERHRCSLDGGVGEWVDVTPPGIDPEVEGGIADVVMDPQDESTLYLAASRQGIWKTENCGERWERVNVGINGPVIQDAIIWTLAQDPFAPNALYTGPRYSKNGLWWSTNGGVHWEQILPNEVSSKVSRADFADIARIAVSPFSPYHVLASSVDPWVGEAGNGDIDAGLFEGRYDADAEQWEWTTHLPADGMDATQRIVFGEDDATWYVTPTEFSGGRGMYKTTDGGQSFEFVDSELASLRGFQMYRATDDSLYRTTNRGLLRSTDDETWVDVFEGLGIGGTQAIIGDGEHLYVSINSPSEEAIPRLYTTKESRGDREWGPYGDQLGTFNYGPFVHDAGRALLYSVAERHGVYRLALE